MPTPLPASPFITEHTFTLDIDHLNAVIAGPAPILPIEECQEFLPPVPEEIAELLTKY